MADLRQQIALLAEGAGSGRFPEIESAALTSNRKSQAIPEAFAPADEINRGSDSDTMAHGNDMLKWPVKNHQAST